MTDVQTFLRQRAKALLESGEVSYIIGWQNTRTPNKTRPAFIHTPQEAEKLVWNKFCINSTAKYLLDDRYPKAKIGLCVRGCDSRAVNRMLADKQIKRENLYIIGIPCDGKENQVCDSCSHKNPLVYDELIGEKVAESQNPQRFEKIKQMEALPLAQRQEFWENEFSKCIRCYACRNVCPACSCRECFADQYRTGWQGKAMNADENRVYGLTRAYHVGDRCIECGECERVCPVNIPIILQTGKMLRDINNLFGSVEWGLTEYETPVLGQFDLGDADEFN